MPDLPKETDKAADRPKESRPESEVATRQAVDGLEDRTSKIKSEREKLAEQNDTLSSNTGAAEKFTIVGLEGEGGKGAAVSERAAAGTKTDYGVDHRSDAEIAEQEPGARVERPDHRTRTVDYSDGSRTTQVNGRVTEVTYPPKGDGPGEQKTVTRKFGYDEDSGALSSITHPDGSTWTRQPPSNEWTKEGTGKKWSGEASVDPETGALTWKDSKTGEAVTEHRDGRSVRQKDGTTITSVDGKVTRVEGKSAGDPPARPAYEYGYDEKTGALNSIKRPDGSAWTRTPPSDEWTMEGSRQTWKGEVTVDPRTGALRYHEADGSDGKPKPVVTEYPDGTRVTVKDGTTTTERPDGTRIEERNGTRVTTTADGTKVTETPDGKKVTEKGGTRITEKGDRVYKTEGPIVGGKRETYEYDYDESGNLKSIKHPDGKQWRRSGTDGVWTHTDDKGKQHTWKGDVSVNQETGAVTWDDPATGARVTDSPDGSRTERKAKDYPTVSTDAAGRITRYEYPAGDGRVSEYKYDSKGRLEEARREDGTTWKKNDKGIYEVYGKDGKLIGKAANAAVGDDGSFSYDAQDKSGRVGRHTERVDGTSAVSYEDGSKYEKDKTGKVTEVEYSPGKTETRGQNRQFEYKGDDIVGVKDKDGTYWAKDEKSGVWAQYTDSTRTKPTGATWEGKVRVDNETGEYAYVSRDGTQVVEGPDRSRVTINPDKSSVVETADGARVVRDSSQRVSNITYPPRPGEQDQESRRFQYDKNGNLTAIEDRDGSVWQKDPKSETWTQYADKDGRLQPTGKTWEGQVAVNKDTGEYVYAAAGEKVQVTEQPDGARISLNLDDKGKPDGSGTIEKPDGSRVTIDRDRRPTRVVDANGKATDYKYDDKGSLVEIKKHGTDQHAASTWTYDDNTKQWSNEYGQTWKGKVQTDTDGNLTYSKGRDQVTERTDGTTLTRRHDGGESVQDRYGRVTQMTDAKGETYKFEYAHAEATMPYRVGAPDGTVWTLESASVDKPGYLTWKGHNPATGEDKSWTGNIEVRKDAVVYNDGDRKVTETLDGTKVTKDINPDSRSFGRITAEDKDGKLKEIEPAVDAAKVAADAERIWEATKGGYTGIGTDKKVVDEILKASSESEKQAMDRYLQEKYGWTLEGIIRDEMSDADLIETIGYLKQKDKEDTALSEYDRRADALRIQKDLAEIQQYVEGRSAADIEKEMRETIAKLNSEQITELERQYREATGENIWEAIKNNPDVSEATKQAIEIYRQGTDKRTDADTLKLADIAMQTKSMEMFEEAMRGASPEARKQFMDSGGTQKLLEAFAEAKFDPSRPGGGIYYEPTDNFKVARDYAEHGKLTVGTAVELSTSWIGDNEKAFESAFQSMTDEERTRYLTGRALKYGEPLPEGSDKLTEQQKKEALAYYEKISSAMDAAGSDWEYKRWEDMIAVKGGGVITRVLDHEGTVYDDRVGDVIAEVEKMTEEEWKAAKENPEQYRTRLDAALSRFMNDDEKQRVLAAFDAKMKAETFDEARDSGQRSVEEKIGDSMDGINYREHDVIAALGSMTADERERYKNNTDGFKKKVDALVTLAMGGDRDAAERILSFAEKGVKPPDIIVTLNKHATDTNADEGQALKDIQKAFRESEQRGEEPTLRDRIKNPQTEEDRLLAQQFIASAKDAIGESDYEDYVKPLIETGEMQAADEEELEIGRFSEDVADSLEGLATSSESGKKSHIAHLEELAASHPDANERAAYARQLDVARHVAEQGDVRPEDKMHAFLGEVGYSKTEIEEMLRNMTPEQKEKMLAEYARKYGTSMVGEIADVLGDKDAKDLLRAVSPEEQTASEAFHDRLQDYMESRDEDIGSSLVDQYWDGTGYQLDAAISEFANEIARASANFEDLPPDKQKELTDNFDRALSDFQESKEAAADALVDATMSIAGIGGAFFTGGVSLALLLKVGAAGAAFKLITKISVMGNDYEASGAGVDMASGFFDAATNLIGPGQIASALKIGTKAGSTAAKATVKAIGKEALKEGSEELLEKEAQKLIREAIATGADKIDDAAIAAVAKGVAKEGAEHKVAAVLKAEVGQALEQESRTAVERIAKEYALDGAANAIGAAGSGAIQGLAEWDPTKPFDENISMLTERIATATAFGIGGGVAFNTAFKAVGGVAKLAGRAKDAIKGGKAAPDAPSVGAKGAPDAAAKAGGAPETKTPATGRPDTGALEQTTPEVKLPESVSPKTEALEARAPEASPSEPKAADSAAPEASPSEPKAADSAAAEARPPEPKAPEAQAKPLTESPDVPRSDFAPPSASKAIPEGEFVTLPKDNVLARGYSVELGGGKTHYRGPDGALYEATAVGDNLLLKRVEAPVVPGRTGDAPAPARPSASDYIPVDKGFGGDGRAVDTPSGRPPTGMTEVEIAGTKYYEDAAGVVYRAEPMGDGQTWITPAYKKVDSQAPSGDAAAPKGEVQGAPKARAGDGPLDAPRTVGTDADGNAIIYKPISGPKPDTYTAVAPDKLPPGFAELRVNGEVRLRDAEGNVYSLTTIRTPDGKYLLKQDYEYHVDMPGGAKAAEDARALFPREPDAPAGAPGDMSTPAAKPVDSGTDFSPPTVRAIPEGEYLTVAKNDILEDGFAVEIGGGKTLYRGPDGSLYEPTEMGDRLLLKRIDTPEGRSATIPDAKTADASSRYAGATPEAPDAARTLPPSTPRPTGKTSQIPDLQRAATPQAGSAVTISRSEFSARFKEKRLPDGRVVYEDADGNVYALLGDGLGDEVSLSPASVASEPIEGISAYGVSTSADSAVSQTPDLARQASADLDTAAAVPPPSSVHELEYSPDGALRSARLQDGTRLRKTSDGWEIKEPGSRQWRSSDRSYRVDENGVVVAEQLGRNGQPMRQTRYRPDGAVEGRASLEALDWEAEKLGLERSAEAAFAAVPERQARFAELMDAIERRADLPDEEVAKVYRHVGELLEAPDSSIIPRGERAILAEEILAHVANPHDIDQGPFGTCAVASIEKALYLRNPSEAARLVTEVATTGRYTTVDGEIIAVDPGSIRRGIDDGPAAVDAYAAAESRLADIKLDGQRTQANQIFQTTAMNVHYQTLGADPAGNPIHPGDLVYTVERPVPGRVDTGERLIDMTTSPPAKYSDFDALESNDIARAYEKITGAPSDGFVIQNSNNALSPSGNAPTVSNVASPAELRQRLEDGNLPAVVRVHTGNEPFFTDSGAGTAGGAGGWHAVLVTGYDPATGNVFVANHWGRASDHGPAHPLTIEALYHATMEPPPAAAPDQLGAAAAASPTPRGTSAGTGGGIAGGRRDAALTDEPTPLARPSRASPGPAPAHERFSAAGEDRAAKSAPTAAPIGRDSHGRPLFPDAAYDPPGTIRAEISDFADSFTEISVDGRQLYRRNADGALFRAADTRALPDGTWQADAPVVTPDGKIVLEQASVTTASGRSDTAGHHSGSGATIPGKPGGEAPTKAAGDGFTDDVTPRADVSAPESDAAGEPPITTSPGHLTDSEQLELVDKMFEFQHGDYTNADYTEALRKIAEHPLLDPRAIDDYVEGVLELKLSWKGKSIEHKGKQLQELMDSFADARATARARIEITHERLAGEAASYQDGVIKVRAAALADDSDPTMLIDRLYHEFTHNEQDALVVRRMADELDATGPGWSPDELRALYKERTGAELSAAHLDQIMEVRKHTGKLSAAEKKRAAELEAALRNYPLRQPWFADKALAVEELRRLSDTGRPDAAKTLLDRLAADEGSSLSRQLFGRPTPPAAVDSLISRYRSSGGFDPAEANAVLKQALGEGVAHYNTRFRHEYYRNHLEVEAHMAGRRAAIVGDARSRSTTGKPEASMADDSTLPPATTSDATPPSPPDPFTDDATPAAFHTPPAVPTEVARVLDSIGKPPGEWDSFIAAVKQSKLASPESLRRFDAEFQKATAGWRDLTPVSDAADKAAQKLDGERAVLDQRISARARRDPAAAGAVKDWFDRRSPDALAQLESTFKGDAVVEAAIRNFKDARRLHGQAEKALRDEIEIRIGALQQMLDSFALEAGLPTVRVGMISGLDPTGDYHGLYVDGQLQLKRSHILSSDPRPELFREAVYHEFIHNEQDYLVLRAVLDDLDRKNTGVTSENISRLLTLKQRFEKGGGYRALSADEQAELAPLIELWTTYRSRSGKGLSDDHLKAVLQAREGGRVPHERPRSPSERALSPQERERADKLAAAFSKKTPLDKTYKDAGDSLAVTRSALKRIAEPGGTYQALSALSQATEHSRNLSRRLFGTESLPPDIKAQLERWLAAGKPVDAGAEAVRVLADALRKREAELSTFVQTRYREYLSGLHETEAFIIPKYLPSEPPRSAAAPGLAAPQPVPRPLSPSAPPPTGEAAAMVPPPPAPIEVTRVAIVAPPLTRADLPVSAVRHVIDRVGGVELAPGRELVLGSGRDADIQIGSGAVDHGHARIRVDSEGNAFVQDLGSVNGTYIRRADGTTIVVPSVADEPGHRGVKLEPGDRIEVAGVPVSAQFKEVRDLPSEAPVVRPGGRATESAQPAFFRQSTAPRRFVAVGGARLAPGRTLTIGRVFDDSLPGTISGRHARVRVDAQGQAHVTDLGSTNGTYVRHADGSTERLEPNVERRLEPGETVLLANHPLPLETALEPTVVADIGGRKIDFHGGREETIGDGRFGVRPGDARLVLKDDGLYLRVERDTPVFVNGQRVSPQSEVPIGLRDSVAIGEPTRVVGQQRQGEWLHLVTAEPPVVPGPQLAGAGAAFRRQSNGFADQDQISDLLDDGFRTGGRRNCFDENGAFDENALRRFSRDPRHERHAFVVDRKNDPELRAVLDDVKQRFGGRDAQGRFKKLDRNDPNYTATARATLDQLTEYVHGLFEPPGWSGSGQLDAWDDVFKKQRPRQAVFLGEYIKQGKGVCIQQAVTLKVLCDELGIDATLVRGAGLREQPNQINHAWVEVRLPGEERPLVYDPRGLVKGKPDNDNSTAFHKRGQEIQQEASARQAQELAVRESWSRPKAPADVAIAGRDLDLPEGRAIQIGRDHVDGPTPQKLAVSRVHAELKRERAAVWLRDTSANGTYIDGVRVPPDQWVSIGPGDRVTLGSPDGPELSLSTHVIPETQPLIRLPQTGEPAATDPGIELAGERIIDEDMDTIPDSLPPQTPHLEDDAFTDAVAASDSAVDGSDAATGIFKMPPPGERPTVAVQQGQIDYPIALDARGKPLYQKKDGIIYHVDGREIPMLESDGGWWKPVRPVDQRLYLDDSSIKVHVYVSPAADLNDLARLQEVLIPSLMDDPELSRLVRDWKTINPEVGHKGIDVDGKVASDGQGAKAFTVYATSPADALAIQGRIDQILSGHPELRLPQPFAGGNVDMIKGESNRVGIVRDHFKRSPASTPADLRIQLDDAVFARILNDPDLTPYRADLQYGGAPRLSGEGLRMLESRLGLAPDTVGFDREGRLTLRIFDFDRTGGYGDIYVREKGAEFHERGQSYQVRARDGSLKTVVSKGLDNRPAVYKIYASYSVDPAEAAAGRARPSVVLGRGDAVVATVDHKGQRRLFEYDGRGELRRVFRSDGSILETADGTTWTLKDAAEPGVVRTFTGKVSVESNGAIVTQISGRDSQVSTLDGAITVIDRQSGAVKETISPYGFVNRFEYGPAGGLREALFADGSQWSSLDGRTWTIKSADGTTLQIEGRLEVSRDGSIAWHPRGGTKTVYRQDGSVFEEPSHD